jgi:hypothetical protein
MFAVHPIRAYRVNRDSRNSKNWVRMLVRTKPFVLGFDSNVCAVVFKRLSKHAHTSSAIWVSLPHRHPSKCSSTSLSVWHPPTASCRRCNRLCISNKGGSRRSALISNYLQSILNLHAKPTILLCSLLQEVCLLVGPRETSVATGCRWDRLPGEFR